MKRVSIGLLFITSVALSACGDNPPGTTPPPAEDATVAQPDATIIMIPDAGPPNVPRPPTITNVQPSSGPEGGGTRVVIRGTSFVEPAEVLFGDQPATSIVVLDEVSIAATTPANPAGSVTVKVTTAGGTAEFPDGFRYHRELVLLAIDPPRVPDDGGVFVRITGKGFDADTIILFDRKPLIGSTLIDAEHIEGYVPALEPGRPEARALHREAETRRSDLLYVYGTPDIRAIAPGWGFITGNSPQSIDGEGFLDARRVAIGGVQSNDLTVESNTRLSINAPILPVGVHNVRIENADAFGELEGGYVAIDPNRVGFEVIGVTPSRISSAGGEVVTVVGYGFQDDVQVNIGGVAAMVTSVLRPYAVTVITPALAPGMRDVEVRSMRLGTSATLANGVTVYQEIKVDAIDPNFGPAAGGTIVTITGQGFSNGVEVRIGDVALRDVLVLSDSEITGITVAGAHGPQDVVVRSSDTRGVLDDGFRFEEAFSLIRVDPIEGSVAGNTYVSIFGRGLDSPVSVKFGSLDGIDPLLENGSVIGVRTPPSAPDTVDVEVTTARGVETFLQAYTFYDPRLIAGGAWGGPVEGSVNVGVLNPETRDPMPGMVVQLGYEADIRYAAITDENGLATISGPELRGAQTITVGQNGVQFVTFMELDARNLTVFASQYPASPPPDAPVPPCPMGAVPPIIRGRLFKFKSSLDPVTHPGWRPVALITYSQSNVFAQNPPDPPGLDPSQTAQVDMDGGEYAISVLRVGTVAVYAILYDYNVETQQAIPRKMGIVRQVPAAIETITEPIDISLDIELNQQLAITLDNPPEQSPGPTINAVFPFLNLESDGVIPFRPTAVGSGTVIVPSLPDLAASQFFYMGGSFTTDNMGGLFAPYSLTLVESGRPFSEGLEMGPFVQMPQNVEPKIAQFLRRGTLRWDQAGIKPDITRIDVVDGTTVGGCCCDDANMNGSCEETEDLTCGGGPVQFDRWSIFAQGGLESYVMPAMLPGLNAFEMPQRYAWLLQEAVAPRFNYREFVYNQFSPFFWTSWNFFISDFVTKEETP